MVKTFQTARKAVAAEKSKSPAQQLEYVAERLKKTATSGSGQLYAEGFERAAKKFEGKSVTPDSIGNLIEAMMGSDTPSQPQQQQSQPSQGGGGDLLTTLLGSLVGGQTTQKPQQRQPEPQLSLGGGLIENLLGRMMGGSGSSSQQSQPSPENLIGSLLGGLSGGSTTKLTNEQNGINAGDLLSGALRYYASKKSGRSDLEAIMSALSKSSPLGGTPERTQSGALVIQTLMKMLGNAR